MVGGNKETEEKEGEEETAEVQDGKNKEERERK